MTVLIVRDEEAGQDYRDAVKNQPVIFAPVQDITYIDTGIPDDYQAIVVTSAHGVLGLARLSQERRLPIFCVGDQTAKIAADKKYETIHIGEGAASKLPELLKKTYPDRFHSILYSRGEEIAFDMANALEEGGFSVIQRVVYCTKLHQNLAQEAQTALRAGNVTAVIFFSSRTAAHFAYLCEKAGISAGLAQTKALCLGGGVLESIKQLPFAAVYTAAHPSRAGLIALIKEQLSQ